MEKIVYYEGAEVGETTFVDSEYFGIKAEDYVTVALVAKKIQSEGGTTVIFGFEGEYLVVKGRQILLVPTPLSIKEQYEEIRQNILKGENKNVV